MRLRMAFVTLVVSAVPTLASAQPKDDAATQRVRLQDVQSRTDEVKAQLRRIHGQLSAVSDEVFRTESASKTEIRFKNEMSDAYRLVHVTALLDGKPLYEKEGDTLSESKEIPVFTGALPSGDHTLVLSLQFKGHGYGVFKYLEGYTFNVKSTHVFTVAGTGPVSIGMTAYEKGDKTTALDLRPAVEWREGVARK